MKKYIIQFAILLISLVSTNTASADVKIKFRQTMSGQTYENTTYIKGKRQRAETMNGQIVTVTQCDLKRDLQLMPQSKVYMVRPYEDVVTTTTKVSNTSPKNDSDAKGGTVTTIVTIKDTGERKQMFGYTARHLIMTVETESSPDACNPVKSKMQQDGWYIDAAFQLDCDRNYNYSNYSGNQKSGCRDKYQVKQIGAAKKGYPVYEKMTMFDDAGKETMSMVNEVVELSQATLSADLFDIPADYREVKNQSELYASMSGSNGTNQTSSVVMPNSAAASNSGISQNVKNLANNSNNAATVVGAKKAGVVRVGMAAVKTGSVGEGMNATELAGAIQNTLGEYLKSPNVEIVALESKLQSAIDAEAKQKECDFVIYANVSHKKGGGGFGMFKSIAPVLGNVVPMAGMSGSVAGAVAGQVASTAIYTAAGVAGNVKPKDEITLGVNLRQTSGAVALTKEYKAKAKSAGEDIISPIIEQAAQAILDAVGKK